MCWKSSLHGKKLKNLNLRPKFYRRNFFVICPTVSNKKTKCVFFESLQKSILHYFQENSALTSYLQKTKKTRWRPRFFRVPGMGGFGTFSMLVRTI